MKVIVKKAGWYGGKFYDEDSVGQEIPDGVAQQFLPPFGDQLSQVGDQLSQVGQQLSQVRESKQLVKVADTKPVEKAG